MPPAVDLCRVAGLDALARARPGAVFFGTVMPACCSRLRRSPVRGGCSRAPGRPLMAELRRPSLHGTAAEDGPGIAAGSSRGMRGWIVARASGGARPLNIFESLGAGDRLAGNASPGYRRRRTGRANARNSKKQPPGSNGDGSDEFETTDSESEPPPGSLVRGLAREWGSDEVDFPEPADDDDTMTPEEREEAEEEEEQRRQLEARANAEYEFEERPSIYQVSNWEDWLDEGEGENDNADNTGDGIPYSVWPRIDWLSTGRSAQAQARFDRLQNRPREAELAPLMEDDFRRRLLNAWRAEEEAEENLRLEDRANSYEAQEATRFGFSLFLFPLVVSLTVSNLVAGPLLSQWEDNAPETFALTDRQKVDFAQEVELEDQRLTFQMAVGIAEKLDPIERQELLKREALHLAEEGRKHNRQSLVNVASDSSAGLALFAMLASSRRSLRFVGRTFDRLSSNMSDTGKAFIFILVTDILLGFHSEAGWETLLSEILAHYGIPDARAPVYIFIAIFPVALDALFKFWAFQYLNKISPSAMVTFKAMNRH